MAFPSVIVDDLYVFGPICRPNEADSPLPGDADAVLSFPIILERFESVAWRYLQIIKNRRPVQLCKFAEGGSFYVHPALHALTFEKGLRLSALEVLDRHGWR